LVLVETKIHRLKPVLLELGYLARMRCFQFEGVPAGAFAAPPRGAGNSASWNVPICQRPFCLVIITIMSPLRGGICDPSGAFVPVMTVSASASASSGVKKRMLFTVSVRCESFRLPAKS
jgi:hypothetical protein